ncbi:MAG: hypothetical protein RI928_1752 [Pseudomonadota bacterium]|jgi:hypothetical protein
MRFVSPGQSLLLCLLMLTQTAWAFERTDGVVVQCEAERNGERREVREVWLGFGDVGDRHPELGGAAAVVRVDRDGWPVIYFDNVVFKAMLASDPHMADFIFYHECAHARDPDKNEIEANCEAFLQLQQQGLMTPVKEHALSDTHRRMRRLPSRYGGSGEIFWEQTMACVQRGGDLSEASVNTK